VYFRQYQPQTNTANAYRGWIVLFLGGIKLRGTKKKSSPILETNCLRSKRDHKEGKTKLREIRGHGEETRKGGLQKSIGNLTTLLMSRDSRRFRGEKQYRQNSERQQRGPSETGRLPIFQHFNLQLGVKQDAYLKKYMVLAVEMGKFEARDGERKKEGENLISISKPRKKHQGFYANLPWLVIEYSKSL